MTTLALSFARARVALAIVSCAITLAAAPAFAQKAISASAAKELFLKRCALCHGKQGQPNAIFAKQGVRAFVDADWQKSRTDAQLRASIQKGRPGTAMVAFEKELKPEQIEGLIKLIRSFAARK